MGKTNEARACEVVSDVLGTVNWEMGDGGHIIIFDQSKAIHLTLNEIYTHVLKAIDKAEKRGRRKVCCEPAPQIDTEKVRSLLDSYAWHCHWMGANDHAFDHVKNEKHGYLRDILAILGME